MKNIANLLFEVRKLKDIPRSGYQFLEAGKESVAEHSFMTVFIAYVMARINPDLDSHKLITMCLVHDLPEARIGDLNYVQKKYVSVNEELAVKDTTSQLPFGPQIADLITEFNAGESLEAKHAKDADQLAFILDLKALIDVGCQPAKKWLIHVTDRLETTIGKQLSENILQTNSDDWWLKNFADNFVDR